MVSVNVPFCPGSGAIERGYPHFRINLLVFPLSGKGNQLF